MILPIVTYGASILQQECQALTADYPNLQELISDMFDTMYAAGGCGLAAPQVNLPIRLFVVDSMSTFNYMEEEERIRFFDGDQGIQAVFLNAEILERSTDRMWSDIEGCLSLPGLSAPVPRPWSITIRYRDHHFREQVQTFSGLTARMIQHEYDHIEGKLYPEYLESREKKLFIRRLNRKRKEGWKAPYPLFPAS